MAATHLFVLLFVVLAVVNAQSDSGASSESKEVGKSTTPCSCIPVQGSQEQRQYKHYPQQRQPYPSYPDYSAPPLYDYQDQQQQLPRGQRDQPYRNQYPAQRQSYPQPQQQQYPSQYPSYHQPYAAIPIPRPSGSRAGGARNLNLDNAPQYDDPGYSNQIQPPSQLSQEPKKETKRPFLTPPTITFRIGIIADLGSEAKIEVGRFQSFLKEGKLSFAMGPGKDGKYNVTVEFEEDAHHIIESGLNNNDEGFELSTLNVFNGKLLSCDDETGIIYELVRKEHNETTPKNETYYAQPWLILPTDDDENTGFKCEWAAVKDEQLWVGSTGILVRQTDENENKVDKTRQGVKVVSPTGQISHQDWGQNYEKIADAMGVSPKGFAVHEAVAWSDILQKWLFMPRRVSNEKFDKTAYHKKAGNIGIFLDDGFENLKIESFGNLTETSGFTSIKFIPGTDDQLILALKAGLDKETNELVSSLEVFDLKGNQIMPETKVAKGIYAGVEFI